MQPDANNRSIVIIGDTPIPDSTTRSIYRAARDAGLSTRYIPINFLSIRIEDRVYIETRRGPLSCDAVIVRGLGAYTELTLFLRRKAALKILEDTGTPVINPVDSLLRARNKLEMVYALWRNKIPTPITVATEDVLYGYMHAQRYVNVVLKPIQGSRGFGAVKMSDPDIAFQGMRTLAALNNAILLQAYVDKIGNRDMRVIVVGERAIGCMYRIAPPGEWRTNIAKGARGEKCPMNSEVEELAIRSVKALGLVYGGVDIGETRDGYVVFEVNASPSWQEFSRVVGVDPAKELINYLLKNFIK